MADELGAETQLIRKRETNPGKFIVEIVVRQIHDTSRNLDQRIAVMGNVDAGKSTLVGVLVNDELDNGRGKSRLQMFRHPHEITTGRTSSICIDLMMFDTNGNVVSDQNTSVKTFEFWDLAGDAKYMKTTLYGLTSSKPGAVMLIVSANKGIQGTTAEQLYAAYALRLPVFVVITKVDLVSPQRVKAQIGKIEEFLTELPFDYVPVVADTQSKAVNLSTTFKEETKVVPMFLTSSVTGSGLDLLRKYINLLPSWADEYDSTGNTEFVISRYYKLEDEDDFVVEGRLQSGLVSSGEELNIGPNEEGKFIPCKVLSIKHNDLTKQILGAGHLATIKLHCKVNISLRKGLHVVGQQLPDVCLRFIAECSVVSISKTKLRNLKVGQLMTAHIGNVRQTVRIDGIYIDGQQASEVCPDHQAQISFAFIRYPEVIRPDTRAVFRDDEIRISGLVRTTFPIDGVCTVVI